MIRSSRVKPLRSSRCPSLRRITGSIRTRSVQQRRRRETYFCIFTSNFLDRGPPGGIPILEHFTVATLGQSGAEYLKREVCRLMLRMLSPSTGSESLRPRHVFFAEVTPSVTGVKHSSVHFVTCVSVSSLHLRTRPQGPQAKRCFYISHHIGLQRSAHCALTPQVCQRVTKPPHSRALQKLRRLVRYLKREGQWEDGRRSEDILRLRLGQLRTNTEINYQVRA